MASWTSNAAFKAVERILSRCERNESQSLYQDYRVRLRMLHIFLRPAPEVAPPYTPFTTGSGLQTSYIALHDFKYCRQYNDEWMKDCLFEDVSKNITLQLDHLDGPRQTETEHIAIDLMLKTMKQFFRRCNLTYELDMNPLLREVQMYIQTEEQYPRTSLIFGMQLLIESYKSFHHCERAKYKANCRTQALRFVQEVRSCLELVLTNFCWCNSCKSSFLTRVLISWTGDMEDYLRERRFDLYYQNPRVAGQHMQEILSLATDYGLRLWDRKSYVAAILHLYNLLFHLGSLNKKVPLFELLSEIFQDQVFLGPPPTTNYESRFKRFLGARIKFDKSPSHENSSCHLDTPRALSSGDVNGRRLIPARVSRFYDIENIRYEIDDERWTDIYKTRKGSKATHKEKSEITKTIHYESFAASLSKMKDYVLPEFSGIFPVAKMNYFAIHLICVKVMQRIAESSSSTSMSQTDHEKTSFGMQFVTSLFGVVDQDQKDPARERLLLPHLLSSRIAKEAIEEVLRGQPSLVLLEVRWIDYLRYILLTSNQTSLYRTFYGKAHCDCDSLGNTLLLIRKQILLENGKISL